ncbi:MAG: two-component system response regulator [Bacteroidetes bacterium]|nr:two-component system response regulator [Bacteroidota bacterium]
MAKTGSILVVDDNKNVLSALRILLESYFQQVTLITSPNLLVSKLREVQPDVVLLDMNFSAGINSGNEGLYWLSEIKKQNAALPVVLFTAYADIELAVRALKDGASDFVVKPWDNAKLVATLQAAMQQGNASHKEQDNCKAAEPADSDICWGRSTAMQELQKLVKKVAKTDANVLITGENGTGKEVIARAVHELSARKHKVMVTVDMGAVTETLFESELFGHVKGAFTDAKADRIGKFEAAQGGTLFLDEIGNLSYPLQAKLLHVIQSRQIVRVGDNRPVPVDIRLICATNRNLQQLVQAGEFREDLLYRVNTIHIEVPPLRERKGDIPQLATFFLRKYGARYNRPDLHFADETMEQLKAYAWPGNVRELQHAIEKAVILCEGNALQPDDFYMRPNEKATLQTEKLSLEDAERLLIANAIKRNNGNLSLVAAELGITRPTLYSKIKKYEL